MLSGGAVIVVVTSLATGFAGSATAGRIISRNILLKNGGPDDVLMIIAFLVSIGLFVAGIKEVQHGVGRQNSEVSPEDSVKSAQALFAAIITYNICLGLVKVSIVLQYLRVFVGPNYRTTRYWCWGILVFSACLQTQATLTGVFTCLPVEDFWKIMKSPGSKCLSVQVIWVFQSGMSLLTDVMILVLPMPALRSLKLPRKQNIGLMSLFAMGILVCFVTLARFPHIQPASTLQDGQRSTVMMTVLSNLEVNLGIISGCGPTLKPVISYFFPNFLPGPEIRRNLRHLSVFDQKGLSNGFETSPRPSLADDVCQIHDCRVRSSLQIAVPPGTDVGNIQSSWYSESRSDTSLQTVETLDTLKTGNNDLEQGLGSEKGLGSPRVRVVERRDSYESVRKKGDTLEPAKKSPGRPRFWSYNMWAEERAEWHNSECSSS